MSVYNELASAWPSWAFLGAVAAARPALALARVCFRPPCRCGLDTIGFRAPQVPCPRHGDMTHEEAIGATPGWRIEAVKERFLKDDNLWGSDFEPILDEALKVCEVAYEPLSLEEGY